MALVRFHPNNYSNTYEHIEVPFMEKEVKLLFEHRINQLQEK